MLPSSVPLGSRLDPFSIGKLKEAYGARLAEKLKKRVEGLAAGQDAGMLESEEL